MSGRVEIFRGNGRILPGYFFRLVAANGEPISVSESFTTKWSCKRSALQVAYSLRVELVDKTVKPFRKFP